MSKWLADTANICFASNLNDEWVNGDIILKFQHF